jgi:DNA-binding protein Fis
MESEDIEEILYYYLLKHLKGNDAYRENLRLYEKPLIKAGLEKFGSQLKLSEILGINRNTLRKKIHENNIDQEI